LKPEYGLTLLFVIIITPRRKSDDMDMVAPDKNEK